MKKIILTLMGAMLLASAGMAQVVTTDPLFPTADDEITFTYNALEGVSGLEGAEKVYIHTGALLPGANDSEWNNVIGNWGEDDGIGLMTKTPDTELWTITFTPRDYYTGDVDFSTETIDRLGMVFRNADGTASGRSEFDSDIFVEIYEPDEYDARLISPSIPNILKDQGETFTIFAASSLTASLSISVNGAEVANTEADTEISYDLLIGDESTYEVTFTAERDGEETITVTRRIIRQVPTPVLALPDNTIAGINYVDNSTVTLSLFAPGKDFVYLIGDFNDWSIEPEYLMNVTPDGNHFWYTLEGLTPNREYLFQYVLPIHTQKK